MTYARWISVLAAGLVLAGGLCLGTRADVSELEDRQTIELDKLPATAKAALLKEAGKSTIDQLDEVTVGGKKTYQASWVAGSKSVEITVSPDGKILEMTAEMTLEQMPATARSAVVAQAGRSKVKQVVAVVENGVKTFEAQWVAEGRSVAVKVSLGGKLLAREAETAVELVPPAVKRTILEQLEDNRVGQVVEILEGVKRTFQAQWSDEKNNEITVLVALDGKLLDKQVDTSGAFDESDSSVTSDSSIIIIQSD